MRNFVYNLRFYLFEKKQKLLSIRILRRFFAYFTFLHHLFSKYVRKDHYAALASFLRYERDVTGQIGLEGLARWYKPVMKQFVDKDIAGVNGNRILSSYIGSQEALRTKSVFTGFGEEFLIRMKYPKEKNDPGRQGDLLILKPYVAPDEKGVLFVQYDEGVKRFSAIYDVERLATCYRIVVEPSTCGYQNPMFFMLLGLNTDAIFEAQYEPDFDYIESIGCNFHAIRLGAGDWTDPNLFFDDRGTDKRYDVVMIANWLKWKRHELLFKIMAEIRNEIKRIAVIGYPIEGRTIDHVKQECTAYGVSDTVDFYERIPHKQVLEIIRQSKVGVLLSKEEGANRGIYECFFSNVPVLLTSLNRGVNRDHLNRCTGRLASDEELAVVLSEMIADYKSFHPRQWALENTGYIKSTRKLNRFLKHLALKQGEQWTRDIFFKHNSPHARYAVSKEQKEADEAFQHLKQFLRA